jgi:hypothetical protein
VRRAHQFTTTTALDVEHDASYHCSSSNGATMPRRTGRSKRTLVLWLHMASGAVY